MSFRKVWEFREVSIDYDCATVGGTLKFKTDMPGGAMAQRLPLSGGGAGVSLPVTAGRQTITIPLYNLHGTLYHPQVIVGAGGEMKLYSATMWARPIGVYLDGSLGESWSPPEISLGV